MNAPDNKDILNTFKIVDIPYLDELIQSMNIVYDDKPHAIYKKEHIRRDSCLPIVRSVFQFKERIENSIPISKNELKSINRDLDRFKSSFISNFGSKELKDRLLNMDFKSFCQYMSVDPLVEMMGEAYSKFNTLL